MIDIENIVVDAVATAVRAAYGTDYPGLCVYSTSVERPESFPCVTIALTDNYTYRDSLEFGKLRENHASVTFTVNVFTNNANGAKSLCKAIFNTVDETLQDLKLTRITASPIDNIDRTIVRYVGRYIGLVGEGITTTEGGEEKTVFVMFRR